MEAEQSVWYSTETVSAVEHLLRDQGLVDRTERVSKLSIAGEGNMNVTLRAEVGEQSFVVKQARPYVAKYDVIPAPIERIAYEAKFYQFCRQVPELSRAMPHLLRWLPDEHLIILEDIGNAPDATGMYDRRAVESFRQDSGILVHLLDWLTQLHQASYGHALLSSFTNRPLRELNHAHIFEIPFQDPPAIDLDAVCPGLEAASLSIRGDQRLLSEAARLGRIYLGPGEYLLHGDFYPGSWLLCDSGPLVIDPEFCFAGPAEFDFGIMVAHMQISGNHDAIDWLSAQFARRSLQHDMDLIRCFAAVEVLRRMLGVAQLPLSLDLEQRVELLHVASDEIRVLAYGKG